MTDQPNQVDETTGDPSDETTDASEPVGAGYEARPGTEFRPVAAPDESTTDEGGGDTPSE